MVLAAVEQGRKHRAVGQGFAVDPQFVRKYVGNDVHGNFGPEHGWHPKTHPKLNNRIQDTVRRTGGWKIYAHMTDDDFPFQQNRFFEEYEAWSAVEQIMPTQVLTEMPKLKDLIAKPMDPPRSNEGKVRTGEASTFNVKSIPEPLTETQRRDRREVLRQQTELLSRSKPLCPSAP